MKITRSGDLYPAKMVRGDTEYLTVVLDEVQTDGTTARKSFASGDTVVMTVRNLPDLMTGEVGTVVFTTSRTASAAAEYFVLPIAPSVTNGKTPGRYVYDVQVTFKATDSFGNTVIKTVVPESPFELIREVTVNG